MKEYEVAPDQFILVDNLVVHAPTGSWWRLHVGKAELYGTFTGGYDASLKDDDQYDVKKIQEIALLMLASSSGSSTL